MKTKSFSSCVIGLLLSFLTSTAFAVQDDASDADLWKGADTRIEKHRKSDVELVVVDAQGKPIPAAKVQVEQINSAFLFGSNIFMWGRCGDAKLDEAYQRRFADIFNFATLGFYWWSYEREQGKPSHEHWMAVAKWCLENGVKPKGHPLAWNFDDPMWLPDDSGEMLRLQLGRIDDCVTHFKGTIEMWDVVNEMAHYDREFIKTKQAPKLTRMIDDAGPIEYTRQCFEVARKANPTATLLINDYRMDAAYDRVIENLVDDQGHPLYDVIGLQSHMHTGTWSNRKIWETCERFAKYGVPLHFTETTIVSGKRQSAPPQGEKWSSTPEGEKRQAEDVVRFYTMLFSHPAVEAITWWDFSDRGTWKGAPAGFLRADMTPKPSYDALRDLIRRKWRTNAELKTNADGTAKLRAFHGDYKITVETPQGEKKTQSARVLKDVKNQIKVAF